MTEKEERNLKRDRAQLSFNIELKECILLKRKKKEVTSNIVTTCSQNLGK